MSAIIVLQLYTIWAVADGQLFQSHPFSLSSFKERLMDSDHDMMHAHTLYQSGEHND